MLAIWPIQKKAPTFENFMEEIKIIDPCIDERWDKFVENHPLGWIVHLSGWKKVIESSFPHMRGYYFALVDKDTGAIKAGLPVYEVHSWLIGKRLVSIPFASLCDPLINKSHDMDKLLEASLNLFKKRNFSYVEIRVFNAHEPEDERLGSNQSYKTHCLLLDKEPDILQKSFHRTNVRQRIQRALNSNISVKIADSESDLIDFFTLYKKTRRKLNLPSQPYAFIKSLWNVFKPSDQVVILIANYNDKPIAGLLLFKYKQRVSAEILGTDDDYLNISPNHLLFWEAIKLAYNEGFKVFDFGRTSVNNESLMTFKNRWGTKVLNLRQFYYPKITNNKWIHPESSMTYKLTQKLCKNSQDFVYDILSGFCYKHLG